MSEHENTPPAVGDEATLEVSDVTTEGEGIARWPGGLVVFVKGALPGDRVRVRLDQLKGRIGFAHVLETQAPAPERRETPCAFQEACGGCPLMPLPEDRVLEIKARQVVETLKRVGRIEVDLDSRRASPDALRYRNRARFALDLGGPDAGFGYRPRGQAGELVAVDECLLLPEGVVELAAAFVARLARVEFGAAAPTHLSVRGSLAYDSWLFVLHGAAGRWPDVSRFASEFVKREPRAAGVVRVLEKRGRVVGTHVLAGRGSVVEKIAGREVPLDATGFLQVNPGAATLLYEEVRHALGAVDGPARLLDLFCGVGLTGLLAAPASASIVGVESHGRAARAAAELAAREGRSADYLAGDARRALRELAASGERFELMIANPPRAGAGADLASRARELGVSRAVLVSCHPATLARDARRFLEEGYRVEYASVVDLFPQTAEVETVLGLARDGAS